MKLTTPQQVIDRLQSMLDEYWDNLKAEPEPTNQRDWSHLHGRQAAIIAVDKMLAQINRENDYFREGNNQ